MVLAKLNSWYTDAPRWQLVVAGVVIGLLVGWAA